MRAYRCIHCRRPVETIAPEGYGTRWIHTDGHYECRATHAAPNFNEPVAQTPEDVESRCDYCGNGYPAAPYIQNCPKCGPGNVECQTCGGTRSVGEQRPGWGRSVRPCPDCTPENVEEP